MAGEIQRFGCATGRVIFGIEIKHNRLGTQRLQSDLFATIAGQGEIGGDLALGNHGALLVLNTCAVLVQCGPEERDAHKFDRAGERLAMFGFASAGGMGQDNG